jgi:anti-sigma regulatory factor (Ser/Thr protein kinase)
MKRHFSSDPASLRDVRKFIRDRAEEASLHGRDTEDLVQAVSEVCANAVLHTGSREFTVSWSVQPGDGAEIKVCDQGVFAPHSFRERAGGFGLPLAAALVDEVSIARGTPGQPGTTVRLLKNPARA